MQGPQKREAGKHSRRLRKSRFIPKCYMEKESDHLDDFAPELAMVTKFGNEARGQFPISGSKGL